MSPVRRRPRRQEEPSLADMSDRQLLEVVFFGNTRGAGGTVQDATPAQRKEARELLEDRGAQLPDPPDPRPILSGRRRDIEAVRAANDVYDTTREQLLEDAAAAEHDAGNRR